MFHIVTEMLEVSNTQNMILMSLLNFFWGAKSPAATWNREVTIKLPVQKDGTP